jgi:hypothetical protein
MSGGVLSGLLRTAWSATLVAGAIGVMRQRSEARRVRAGELAPDGPDGDRAPLTPQPGVMAALATWLPTPPRTGAGRWATTLWSAPLSAVGLGVALASGAIPRWDPERRCFVATGVGGPSGAALRLVGAGANTVGQVVLCRSDAPSAALLDHEAMHVRQAERLGLLLVPTYLWCNAIRGYRDNPLEHAARLGARVAAAARVTRASDETRD